MANAYQLLVKEKGKLCKGKSTKSKVRKRASIYIRSAVKKADAGDKKKARKEATAIAKRKMNEGCSVSTHIGKKKKRSRKRVGAKMVHALVMGKRRRSRKRR